jgi:uncharacterized protein YraI
MTAAVPLMTERAEAQQQLLPAALPPWGSTATTTMTETKSAPIPAATLAPSVESDTAMPGQSNATPIQGTTTPIQAVSLRSGPNTAAPVIGTLRPGMAVRVLASANYGWMQVETPVGSGWTYGSYLAPIGSAAVIQYPTASQEIIIR